MLTKNLTPFLFGAKVCSRRSKKLEMTMVVRATYALAPGQPLTVVEGLDQGFLTGDVYKDDDEERRGDCLYASDFADYKLNAEVLLRGTCHAPLGRPVDECTASVAVGAWKKILRVVGRRVWSDAHAGAAMSAPIPFTKMPVDYAHAFGGPGFAKNPVGKGYGTPELPNVEAVADPVRGRGDRPEPAGFGPISATWPQRANKLGEAYGKAWKETRAPFYAEDFDWTHFSAAPPDQQLKGFLRGDEEVTIQNLHPAASLVSAKLPALRVRAFAKSVASVAPGEGAGLFREVPMVLDTLFIDVDAGQLVLTWRGLTEVKEEDLVDVATVLVASEPLAEAPLPPAHYAALLDAFESDPIGLEADMPEELIALGEQVEREHAGGAAPDLPDTPSGLLKQQFGGLAGPDVVRDVDHAAALALEKGQGKVDVAGAVRAAAKEAAAAPPIAFVPLRPGVLPSIGLKQTIRDVMAKVAALKDATAANGAPALGLDALEALPNDPRLKQLDPSYTPPGAVSTDEPGPGRNLAEQDLSHRDLSGMDLSAAILEGANLTGAKLAGAKLTGANLKNATLFKADLTGADLAGADLTLANASRARLGGANLRGAVLADACFEKADLAQADLTDVQADYVVFAKADLTGARAVGARLDHSDLSEAKLEGAELTRASVTGCAFSRCAGKRVDLCGAILGGANFSDADLEGARFTGARGDKTYWARARVDAADFSYGILPRAHFTEVSAIGARFFGANLREARFYRANLERAEFAQANLMSADLCKARLEATKFTNANLYDAKFLQASGARCDFTGANLKRSTLEGA